jgi:hypothetical protein
MSYEDFKMFDEWNKSQQEVAAQAAIPRPPVLVPASWGKRLGAYLIDSFLLGIPLYMFAFRGVFSELQARMPELVDPVTGQTNPAAVQELTAVFAGVQLRVTIAYLILGGAYYILMHGLKGQTLGKMVLDTGRGQRGRHSDRPIHSGQAGGRVSRCGGSAVCRLSDSASQRAMADMGRQTPITWRQDGRDPGRGIPRRLAKWSDPILGK